jgi:o-succinylbenzoate---CoA ligase
LIPDLILDSILEVISEAIPEAKSGWIMIPTGGSSGQVKFAIHTWQTLSASVAGLQDYFQMPVINSFCVLPVYHVSGLMQFMRSLLTGGNLVITTSKHLETNLDSYINPQDFFISLVPTQLQKILNNPITSAWLSQFQAVFLGGGAAWSELLNKARYLQIPLALTYGMTETASQIATLKPQDFLAGNNSCGQVLPHARIIFNEIKVPLLKGDLGGSNLITSGGSPPAPLQKGGKKLKSPFLRGI